MNWFLACMVWLFIYFYGNVTLTQSSMYINFDADVCQRCVGAAC